MLPFSYFLSLELLVFPRALRNDRLVSALFLFDNRKSWGNKTIEGFESPFSAPFS